MRLFHSFCKERGKWGCFAFVFLCRFFGGLTLALWLHLCNLFFIYYLILTSLFLLTGRTPPNTQSCAQRLLWSGSFLGGMWRFHSFCSGWCKFPVGSSERWYQHDLRLSFLTPNSLKMFLPRTDGFPSTTQLQAVTLRWFSSLSIMMFLLLACGAVYVSLYPFVCCIYIYFLLFFLTSSFYSTLPPFFPHWLIITLVFSLTGWRPSHPYRDQACLCWLRE